MVRVARAVGLAVGLLFTATSALATTDQVRERVRRLSSILDYVAADYGEAVEDGAVVDDHEYEEQIEFLEDAASLAARLPPPGTTLALSEELDRLLELVQQKAPPAQVAEACRGLRRTVLDTYRVKLAPADPTSWEQGEALYAQQCASCHGANGAGDGRAAAQLDPPPRSFRDAEIMSSLSPVRAFNALTDGIEGTAMPAFQALSSSERWSLAFYVFGLRHTDAATARGEAVVDRVAVAPELAELAEASDGQLLEALESAGARGAEAMDGLAFLRRHGAVNAVAARALDRAHDLVQVAEQAHRSGDARAALDAVTDAYLEGFEPVEAPLAAKDRDLVHRVEDAFHRLRGQIDANASPEQVSAAAEEVHRLLGAAQATLDATADPWLPFVASATVILREGVESVLLVFLLLGLARRAGDPRDVRMVHLGWMGAVAAGAALWFLADMLVPLSGASREALEGVIALLAAVVLLYASHFVLARLDAERRIEALKRRFAAAGPQGRAAVLLSLGFAAVFREAFEVVLFLQAIQLEASGRGWAVASGALVGALACAALFVALRATGKRLNISQLLTASGTLLCGLAVIMTGKGVHALQEAGWIGAHLVALPRVDWLGFYPTLQTAGAQGLAVVAIIAIAWAGRRAARRPEPSAA